DFKMEAAPDNTALTTQFDYKVNGNVVQNDNTIVDFGSKFEIDDKSQIDTPATIVGKEWIVKKDGTEIYRGSTPYTGYANEEGTYETTLINTGSNGLTGTVTKTVRVAKKPTINIPDSIVIEGKDKYNKDDLKNGVTATDKTGKDISGNIVIDDSKITAANGKPGKYDVTYKVTDEYGVTTEKTVEVTVIERIPGLDINKAPKINIPGNIVIQGGDKYNKDDLKNGITATDKEGNDISGNIVIDDSKIDKEHSGTYNVIYTVKDKDGITTKVEVPVKVEVKVPGLDINKAPKFNVSGDLSIIEGNKYDPKDAIKDNKITATDGKGKDISNKIEVVKNNVKPDVPGKYDVTYKVTDADGISKEITVQVIVHKKSYDNNTGNNVDTDKIQGNNRIETAVEASKKVYPSGTPVVVLANAERYTDVLTANPFAIQENGAALLTYKYDIPKKTMEEIERLGARKIYISGGYDAVSKKVVTELENKGYDIFRFDGVNRYDTARKIAIKIREKGNKNMAELASGEDFPDALCMAPLAVKDKAPILLAKKDSIPYYTKQALAEWDIENIKIAGLDKAISNNVEKSLEKGFKLSKDSKKDSEVYTGAKSIKRIGGYDRYETSSAIAKEAYPNTKLGVYATGEDFPDALIAGNYAGRRESAVLLVKKDVLPESIEKHTKASSFNKITVIGGKDAISEKVINSIKKAIK
ncbi:cell wall-binding repeat-containing protein, partial [Peptacetobacter sp.]|uniref:cell wall-binding repeat-containing protein n=1 Tax=Peptacetobacter sp. TaxID=2991975 RepID=UPI0026091F1D